MKQQYVIDGKNFATLESFYHEIGKALIPGQEWGHNLDAFNDILSWPEEPYTLVWQNSELSRQRLGYDEAARWLEERSRNAHPTNRAHFRERLQAARQQQGPTVFDWLVEIIRDNSDYGVELVLA